jgi:hypothetical protein
MKYILIILSFLLFNNCSKPKTVLICGDHVCINNDEAKQYFEENLSIEVKIINKRIKKEENLVELNLKDVPQKRQISINNKKQTNEIIKVLSNKEVKSIKKKIKKNKKNKKKSKIINTKTFKDKKKLAKKSNKKLNQKTMDNDSLKKIDIVDVCTIIEKCSIDQISKYLLKKGRQDNYPDITIRE